MSAGNPAKGETTLGRDFVISRTFDAPRSKMFEVWTEREHLMRWFGPKGFTMPIATLDLRPGGTFLYCLKSAEGQTIWGKFVYREIVPPERLVFNNYFSDEHGGVTRHPMMPTWPLELLTTVTFTEQAGQTTVTIQWNPVNATPEEQAAFDGMHAGMTQGWSGTFEQLAAYLARQ